jgi:hypothetical protein
LPMKCLKSNVIAKERIAHVYWQEAAYFLLHLNFSVLQTTDLCAKYIVFSINILIYCNGTFNTPHPNQYEATISSPPPPKHILKMIWFGGWVDVKNWFQRLLSAFSFFCPTIWLHEFQQVS